MKIIGFDYPCMDMNVLCPHMPAEEELVELLDVSLMGGGKVANAIIAAARLGADTAFIGAVGSDRYGRLCREDLRAHGTDVTGLKVRKGHTALCVSIIDKEKRGKHFIESVPTIKALETEDLPLGQIRGGDYLMLYQMDPAAAALAEYAHRVGAVVVVDGDEYDERTQENLGNIDVLIMSEYYYRHLTQETPEAEPLDPETPEAGSLAPEISEAGSLAPEMPEAGSPAESYARNLKETARRGPGIVVVTLGAKGCVGVDHGKYFETAAFPVKAEDTTGAGDVFHGAFAVGLSEGMDAAHAAELAGAVSAIKCTRLGGRTGIPTRECVEHFLRTGEIPRCDFPEREAKYREDMWR